MAALTMSIVVRNDINFFLPIFAVSISSTGSTPIPLAYLLFPLHCNFYDYHGASVHYT